CSNAVVQIARDIKQADTAPNYTKAPQQKYTIKRSAKDNRVLKDVLLDQPSPSASAVVRISVR
ncbi:MAG: hypothetical protein AB2693_25570, partial [Candidatus Thiodiazotropha sp.]